MPWGIGPDCVLASVNVSKSLLFNVVHTMNGVEVFRPTGEPLAHASYTFICPYAVQPRVASSCVFEEDLIVTSMSVSASAETAGYTITVSGYASNIEIDPYIQPGIEPAFKLIKDLPSITACGTRARSGSVTKTASVSEVYTEEGLVLVFTGMVENTASATIIGTQANPAAFKMPSYETSCCIGVGGVAVCGTLSSASATQSSGTIQITYNVVSYGG